MRKTTCLCVAPWVPPPRHDIFTTVPPPPGGEVGGSFGVSTGYSDRLARTPHWKRMAMSTYALRMKENTTFYPMSVHRPGDYDVRYLATPYPDHLRHRPLLEVGEARQIPAIRIPVIFLRNVFDDVKQVWIGKKHETVYVARSFAREELIPQRMAIYATEEAYRLLHLPVVHHHIHDEIPHNMEAYRKLMEKQHYDEQQWQYTVEYLFKAYEAGPPELRDVSEEEWDGVEEVVGSAASSSASGGGAAGSSRKGPIKQRKARKIKLF